MECFVPSFLTVVSTFRVTSRADMRTHVWIFHLSVIVKLHWHQNLPAFVNFRSAPYTVTGHVFRQTFPLNLKVAIGSLARIQLF